MKKQCCAVIFASLCFILPVFAKVSFDAIDINSSDELLFTVQQELTGLNPYKSLLKSHIKNGEAEKEPELITCFPEQMDLLSNGKIIQIRNRYGTARYNIESENLKWIFRKKGIPFNSFSAMPNEVSPDGKWLCKIEQTDVCLGNLVIENPETGKTVILVENILNSYGKLPVKWSPDSSILVYEKDSAVYFCSPDAVLRGVEIQEKFRKIGRGTINSVYWSSSRYLSYIDDYIVYRLHTKELYTMGLYAGIIGQGKAMGRLPFQFNPASDTFSANDDVTGLVIMQNGKLFTYLKVQSQSCDYMDVVFSHPYTDSSSSLVEAFLFWDLLGEPILWLEKLPYNGNNQKCSVYNLAKSGRQVLEIQGSGRPILSPDGSRVAFFAKNYVFVYDLNTWNKTAELGGEEVCNILWINSRELCVGGENTVRIWKIFQNQTQTICLSSAESAYWSSDVKDSGAETSMASSSQSGREIVAKSSNGKFYVYNYAKNTWSLLKKDFISYSHVQNSNYRVYTAVPQNENFKNALFIRSLSSKTSTKALYPESVKKSVATRKVAVVFDAYDNSDGLAAILTVLEKYKLKATFFLNGEFIRRYPLETNQIVSNGHECASMFFTTSDLQENGFSLNEDFISRGLARNEDEFYECTGRELDLYWHAPYYKAGNSLKLFGLNAGYVYVDANYKNSEFSEELISPAQFITEFYGEVNKGQTNVIPICVGFSQGLHPKPLYNYLDSLVSALIDGGFEIVPVSKL